VLLQWRWRAAAAVFVFSCVSARAVLAAEGPLPPCDTQPVPAYADVDAPVTVTVWQAQDLPRPWTPPACLRWKMRGFAALIAVSGRIGGVESHRQLLQRLTAASAMSQIRYWSYTRKRWRRLFLEVVALDGPDPSHRRADFAVDDIRTGQDYFLWQKENSLASGMVFRQRALELSESRMVFQQENVSASRIAFVVILGRGEFETVAFLDKERRGIWRYYSLSRVGAARETISKAELASLINRLVAGFRYLAGIATDREPPAAP
jgi:hypothetical protein